MSYPFDLETFISENKELVKEYINKDTMNVEIPDIELDSSDFYRNNEQLSTHKIDKYQFTLLQKLEYVKCFKDVVYFTEKYGKVISVDDGIIPFKLWDFQKDLLRLYQNHRFVVAAQCRQSGKCLSADTKIKLRNKNTGEIVEMTAEEFHELQKVNK